MTSKNLDDTHKIGRVIRASRKWRNLTQAQTATAIEVSQSFLSKLETGQLEPDTSTWFKFCDLVKVSPECWRNGFIDSLNPADLRSGEREFGFRVPERYADHRGTKVRALLPFIATLRNRLGDRKLDTVFEEMGFDPAFFMILDNQVNWEFTADLIRWMKGAGHLNGSTLTAIAATAEKPTTHGLIANQYEHSQTTEELLRARVENSKFYDCDFQFDLTRQSKNSFALTLSPETHVLNSSFQSDAEVRGIYNGFMSQYLERFASYHGPFEGVVKEVPGIERESSNTDARTFLFEVA